MKKKYLWIAVVIVSIMALAALFIFSWKAALLVVLAAFAIAFFLAVAYVNVKAWEKLEKHDPKLARELWLQAMIENDRYRIMF